MSDAAQPRLPQWLRHLRAALGGYFWIACPLDGTYFGGHEWSATWWYEQGNGRAICWKHDGDVFSNGVTRYV